MNYTLELSENEVNQVLSALVTRPYAEVYELIHSISEQIKRNQEKAPNTDAH